MSRFIRMLIAAGALSLAGSSFVWAQGTATQTVNFEVQRINVISVSGGASLTISTATAGSQPTQASDASTTYNITSNDVGAGAGAKITMQLNSDMPTDVTLKATLAPPSGATSSGAVTLTHSAVDAVTGVIKEIGNSLAITYTLDALVTAGVVAPTSRTVTFTVVAAI